MESITYAEYYLGDAVKPNKNREKISTTYFPACFLNLSYVQLNPKTSR